MISVSAIIQIAILYLVIYAILKRAKGSRFGQVLMGAGMLVALLVICTLVLHFDVLGALMKMLLMYLALSTVVIFQPEIRRGLSAVGAFSYFEKPKWDNAGMPEPEYVVDILKSMAEKRMGAIIAFERGISLKGYEHTGVKIDGVFSSELVRTIFTPPLPLHDGGMIIRNGRIAAAHCVFPVSNNPELITSGMRHRAAVGISDETDAIVITVSEERGVISIAHNGKLIHCGENGSDTLVRWVTKGLRGNVGSKKTLGDRTRDLTRKILLGRNKKDKTE